MRHSDEMYDSIDLKSISPNDIACDIAEKFESSAYRILKDNGERALADELFLLMKKGFIRDLKVALDLTNTKEKTSFIDYKDWVLAGDSFMINEAKIYAVAFTHREKQGLSDLGLKDIIIDDISKLDSVVAVIINSNIIEKEDKVHGLKGVLNLSSQSWVQFKNRDSLNLVIEKEIERSKDEKLKEELTVVLKEMTATTEKKKEDKRKFTK